MCKFLKIVIKRNKNCKYFKVIKVEFDSFWEDLMFCCGYNSFFDYRGVMLFSYDCNSLLDYKVEINLLDKVGLNLFMKEMIGILKKYRILKS